MEEPDEFDMRRALRRIGIFNRAEQDLIIEVALRCAEGELILRGAYAYGGMADFLASLVTGAKLRMALGYSAKKTIRQIGAGEIGFA